MSDNLKEEFNAFPESTRRAIIGFWDYPIGPFKVPTGIDPEIWCKFTYGCETNESNNNDNGDNDESSNIIKVGQSIKINGYGDKQGTFFTYEEIARVTSVVTDAEPGYITAEMINVIPTEGITIDIEDLIGLSIKIKTTTYYKSGDELLPVYINDEITGYGEVLKYQ